MKKRIVTLLVLTFAFVCTVFGQTALTVADIRKLNEKMAELYSKGELEKVVELAGKVSEAERNISGEDSVNYALALTNLAAAEKEAAVFLTKTLRSRYVVPRSRSERSVLEMRRKEYREKADRYARSASENFLNAFKIYEGLGKLSTVEAAAIQGQLAWVTYAFRGGGTVAEARSQIDRAESLYLASLATFESLGASSSDSALRIRLDFANFYYDFANFEKALPLYETYVSLLSAKNGNEELLVPALRKLKAIADITLQESQVKTLEERLATLNSKDEDVRYPSLILRSRKLEPVADSNYIPHRLSDPTDSGTANSDKPESPQSVRSVLVQILVDENGNVIEATTIGAGRNKELETAALASKFRPFSYNGVGRKMRGVIPYRFRD